MSETTFDYHGVELAYFDHLYNITFLNERRVEIAVAHHRLGQLESPWHRDGGLEVGNVLGHYEMRCHRVFDLYEQPAWYQDCQKVHAVDILKFLDVEHPMFPWVISISTVEHTEDPVGAIEALRSMVAPGGWLLVTFPTGVNDELDELIQWCDQTFTRWCTMSRDGEGWRQDVKPVISPYGPWANSVAICEWEAPS